MRLLLLFLLCTRLAFAADKVSLEFDAVPAVELARLVYVELQKKPVMFTPDALAAKDVVTISLRGLSSEQAVMHLNAMLERAGFTVSDRAGVVWIDRRTIADDLDFIYRPRFRAASYLLDMLAPLFKAGSFTTQRGGAGVSQQSTAQQGNPSGQMAQPQGGTQSPNVVDNGMSAYSLGDKNPDVLFFHGRQADIDRLKRALAQVDTPTPELFVKAVVYEVSTTDDDRNAITLALNILKGKLQLGNVTPGQYSGVFHVGKLDIVMDALSTDSRFKVVSSPALRVRSGSSAKLTVGTQTPVLGSTSIASNGTTVQSVEYRPSGVILDLKPEVRADIADIKITQQISNFVQTNTGVNTSPTLVTRELSTQVGVRDQDVLVLGGLDEEKDSGAFTGLSFLPSWLSSKSTSKAKTEVLIVLQATRI